MDRICNSFEFSKIDIRIKRAPDTSEMVVEKLTKVFAPSSLVALHHTISSPESQQVVGNFLI